MHTYTHTYIYIFCITNAASKSIILACILFLYEKMKNYSIQYFKEYLFFVFFFFYFLLLSNNTLYVMYFISLPRLRFIL